MVVGLGCGVRVAVVVVSVVGVVGVVLVVSVVVELWSRSRLGLGLG